jgi:hypothetical protein
MRGLAVVVEAARQLRTGEGNMTPTVDEQDEEVQDRTSGDWPGVGRRPLLKALGVGTALSVGSGAATAGDDDVDDDGSEAGDNGDSDEHGEDQSGGPKGFSVEVAAPHATFTDDVAAAFGVTTEDGAGGSAFLHDASTVVVRASLEPGGTSGGLPDLPRRARRRATVEPPDC